MVWMLAGMAALSVLGGVQSGRAQRRAAQNQRVLARAEMEAETITRDANNISRAAESSLSDYVRSLNNQQAMKAAGDQFNTIGMNLRRNIDQNVKGNLAGRIQAAEEAGAAAASAAWAGVAGSTVDLVDGTRRLRDAIIQQDTERQQGYMTFDAVQQQAGVIASGVDQIDFRQAFAGIDTKSSIERHVYKPSWDQLGMNIVMNTLPQFLPALGNFMDAKATGAARTKQGVSLVGSTGSNLKL